MNVVKIGERPLGVPLYERIKPIEVDIVNNGVGAGSYAGARGRLIAVRDGMGSFIMQCYDPEIENHGLSAVIGIKNCIYVYRFNVSVVAPTCPMAEPA